MSVSVSVVTRDSRGTSVKCFFKRLPQQLLFVHTTKSKGYLTKYLWGENVSSVMLS